MVDHGWKRFIKDEIWEKISEFEKNWSCLRQALYQASLTNHIIYRLIGARAGIDRTWLQKKLSSQKILNPILWPCFAYERIIWYHMTSEERWPMETLEVSEDGGWSAGARTHLTRCPPNNAGRLLPNQLTSTATNASQTGKLTYDMRGALLWATKN